MAVPATIQTTSHMLRGHVHIRHGERMKDELDRNKTFLAVTDVSVLGGDGQVLFHAPFIAVHRSQIIWVMPNEEGQGK